MELMRWFFAEYMLQAHWPSVLFGIGTCAAAVGGSRYLTRANNTLEESINITPYSERPPEGQEQILASVLKATEGYRQARRLMRRVQEANIGICELSKEGVVEQIDGGALAVVGVTREDYVGQKLTDPKYLAALEAAMRGERTTFAELDPAGGSRYQIVQYSPWGGDDGEPAGAIVVWLVGGKSQRFEVTDDR